MNGLFFAEKVLTAMGWGPKMRDLLAEIRPYTIGSRIPGWTLGHSGAYVTCGPTSRFRPTGELKFGKEEFSSSASRCATDGVATSRALRWDSRLRNYRILASTTGMPTGNCCLKTPELNRQLKGGMAGTAFLLGNVLCWSIVPVLLRYLTGAIDGWTANGVRYPISSVLYWPVLMVAWRSGELTSETLRRCLVPSIFGFGGQVLWALAPYYLPASAIGFFIRSSLVFALVGAMLLFPDERRLLAAPKFYVGLVLLIGGFVLMSVRKVQFDQEVTESGILIILLCGVFFGFYGVSVRYFLRGVNPLVGFGVVSNLVSVGTIAAACIWGDYGRLGSVHIRDWWVLVGSSVLGIALGHYFLYNAVTRLGAAITSGAQTLTPFPTMLLAAWLLHETMAGLEWFAGLTMVVGAAVLLVAQNQIVRHSKRSLCETTPDKKGDVV
jgi:drug/metabolite transporter (DMT)-like permease